MAIDLGFVISLICGTILITGATSGFGLLPARRLAIAGHTVCAGLFSPSGDTTSSQADINSFALAHNTQEEGIDTLIHNAGHMTYGPAEALSADQFHRIYEINCVGAHRVNQVFLPSFRARRSGHLNWVSSFSAAGAGVASLFGPYIFVKAAMDSLAVSYALELRPFRVKSSVVVPRVFSRVGGAPLENVPGVTLEGMEREMPKDADVGMVIDAVVEVVGRGKEGTFRVHVDPFGDGSEEVNEMADKKRDVFLGGLGSTELLKGRK
ncbi:NAD(P)-binding protein [Zopfia rhizophila CBS 207.26]|uniref:NAD(P)-binding protein n=1 Tax=Zopfia rhizophila CBS 207.26 TaxID=1314779 RepID=A0A6A6EKA9_9PEZI|nr:NAD(P)-binding protein [Zopfia rhizophila CBS 207.26]